jgi:NADH-quinone oxidoreductase subunit I
MLSENYRGMLALRRYDDGTEKCVGCDLCEAACSFHIMTVVNAVVPVQRTRRDAREHSMDMTRCLFCGLCLQACPVDPLAMTREYEWAVYGKVDLFLNRQQQLAIGDCTFRTFEKRPDFQHRNPAVFNIAASNHLAKAC